MLYLVATPIGNLGDITYRAVEILKSCDYILSEDTRHSKILLGHYGIHKPLKSFHKFSEASKESDVIEDLIEGKVICLISDAGTPGIADPGERLVKACVSKDIKVVSIPGPCAAIGALSCSGLETGRFQFLGFLPRKSGELRRLLQEILAYSGTTVCYESPNRLCDVLSEINEIAPERTLAVARELTKMFEEIVRGNASALIRYWETHPLRGEIVLLISGQSDDQSQKEWEHLSPEEHVLFIQSQYGITKNEAIKMAAGMRGVPKRMIYNKISK